MMSGDKGVLAVPKIPAVTKAVNHSKSAIQSSDELPEGQLSRLEDFPYPKEGPREAG